MNEDELQQAIQGDASLGDPEYRDHEEVVAARDDPQFVEYERQIYMVRGNGVLTSADPSARREWTYEGREYGSEETELLTARWLNDNYMRTDWRQARFGRYNGQWFRVAVLASKKQKPRSRKTHKSRKRTSLEEQRCKHQRERKRNRNRNRKRKRKRNPHKHTTLEEQRCKRERERNPHKHTTLEEQRCKHQRERRRKRNRKRKRKRTRKPHQRHMKCIPACLAMAMQYMGLERRMRKMIGIQYRSLTFGHVAKVLTKTKKLLRTKMQCDKFQILKADPTKLYLVQATARHSHDSGNRDNTHSIAVFNKHIFDVTKKMLPLNAANLDACMLGGPEWVYSHASKVLEFTMKETLKKIVDRNIIDNIHILGSSNG